MLLQVIDFGISAVVETLHLHIEPRWILQRELQKRCSRNPHYSLRAFAKALGLSPTVLSLVISGKRPLSKKAADKVSRSLNLSAQESAALKNYRKQREELPAPLPRHVLDLDTFGVISDWYHYAILSLLELPEVKLDARWIATRLGITAVEARLALERLIRLGLISEVNGRWKQNGLPLKLDDRQSTSASRRFQKQLIEKALESIENDPLEIRDQTSITFAMNRSQIEYAKKRITEFRRKLCDELESIVEPDSVYTLTIQLFPLTKQNESKSGGNSQ